MMTETKIFEFALYIVLFSLSFQGIRIETIWYRFSMWLFALLLLAALMDFTFDRFRLLFAKCDSFLNQIKVLYVNGMINWWSTNHASPSVENTLTHTHRRLVPTQVRHRSQLIESCNFYFRIYMHNTLIANARLFKRKITQLFPMKCVFNAIERPLRLWIRLNFYCTNQNQSCKQFSVRLWCSISFS